MTTKPNHDPPEDWPEAAEPDLELALARLEQTSAARLLHQGGDPRPAFVTQLENRLRESSPAASLALPTRPQPGGATWFPWLRRGAQPRLGMRWPLRLAVSLALVVLVLGAGMWLTRPSPANAAAILARATAGNDIQSAHGTLTLRQREAADQPWNEGTGEIWFVAPDKIHEELTLRPAGGSANTQFYVSDGTTGWSYDPPPDAVVIRDADPELTNLFAATNLAATLQAVGHGQYTAVLAGNDTVAGRSAYMLDLTRVAGGTANEARIRLWVDQQAYFPLRQESWDQGGQLLVSLVWTSVQVNESIDPGVFTFVPPPGALVRDIRVRVSTVAQTQKWQAAAQHAGYPIFMPAAAIPGQREVADVVYEESSRQVVTHIVLQLSNGDTTTLSTLTIQEAPEAALTAPGAGDAVKVGDLSGQYLVQDGQAILGTVRDGTRIVLHTPDSPAAKGLLLKVAQTMQPVPMK